MLFRSRENLSKDYLKFLKESGYAPELDSASGLMIAKRILKYNQSVRDTAQREGLSLNGADGTYIVSISQPDGRNLIESLGGKLLTTGLMYKLFIPYIKELAQNGNAEAQETLNEMINTKAEWLEDLVLDKSRLKIGNKKRRITLPNKNGRYDRADISEFGYPTSVKNEGEFFYWHVSGDERAAFRGWDSELNLSLGRELSVEVDGLGVRRAKFFIKN